jgi:hypothetical protein
MMIGSRSEGLLDHDLAATAVRMGRRVSGMDGGRGSQGADQNWPDRYAGSAFASTYRRDRLLHVPARDDRPKGQRAWLETRPYPQKVQLAAVLNRL